MDIQRILCPVDFSETSRHALEHALAIAEWYQSGVTVLHVLAVPSFLAEPPILLAEFPRATARMSADRHALEERLRAWLGPARANIATDVHVGEGEPAASILEQADAVHADLIAMGTHGLSGFDRFVLGSVAEKVLRKAKIPVLTVPPAAVITAKVPYTRLLCPVDFSESSLAALQFAFSLAEESDARLTVLHVFDWRADDELVTARFDAPEFRRQVEERGRLRLEKLIPDDVRVWCKPTTAIAYGKAYVKVLDVAAADGTDLIVMGVRGRNPVDLALFGSTTNQVLRRAACPVVTLRQ